ncbi:electron transfer flavoprotein subunit beta/FixA family protein [Glaciibacter psychrotolerans]|uniref:Electron transfer flavoprotein subunit beta n=1 Tax=Glaciibacter psychrotolerans TaxID=670054 RepID=A0A7Z0EGH1_9MICO|nr:electron transfer flavoprotein subunit beta/FixA family protein [Leifsonia psychrotolerans]NYJ20489.1 electron transfer flavoprotein beta subunit [Leifsonia psychrotolerans]
MKLIVLVKEVPDTYGDRTLNPATGLAERAEGENVLDEICERALEVALGYADGNPDAEVVLLSLAPERAQATLRKGLAMGAGSAVQILDEALVGADLGLTAEVLAAAITRIGFDVVITGNQSTDGSGGVLGVMIAELLGVPAVTNLTSVQFEADTVSGERATDGGAMRISAALPAVVSITESLPDGRFPSFKGIMAAKKKPYEMLSLTDLGVDPGETTTPRSIMISLAERPARTAGTKIVDDGDAAEQLVNYLVANRLV